MAQSAAKAFPAASGGALAAYSADQTHLNIKKCSSLNTPIF